VKKEFEVVSKILSKKYPLEQQSTGEDSAPYVKRPVKSEMQKRIDELHGVLLTCKPNKRNRLIAFIEQQVNTAPSEGVLDAYKFLKLFEPTKKALLNLNEPHTQIESVTKEDSNLTIRLLIIHYLQEHGNFPKHNTKLGQTQGQFQKFITSLLNEKPDTIKKGFQRLPELLDVDQTTNGNKSDRIGKLQHVLEVFKGIDNKEVVDKISKLLKATVEFDTTKKVKTLSKL